MTPRRSASISGTTNSVVALAGADGSVTTRSFADEAGRGRCLSLRPDVLARGSAAARRSIVHVSGPDALDMALGMTTEHSLPAVAQDPSLQPRLPGRRGSSASSIRLEDLIGTFLYRPHRRPRRPSARCRWSPGARSSSPGERPDEELARRPPRRLLCQGRDGQGRFRL